MTRIILQFFFVWSTFLWCFSVVKGQSQSTGFLAGVVLDSASNRAIVGATLRIENHSYGTYTNQQGRFLLRSLPAGQYSVLISMLGYTARRVAVRITPRDTTSLTLYLREQLLQTNDVVVAANKRVQAVQDVPISIATVDQRAIQQRNITRLDDALRYVPGVYMARDQINVRGSSGFSLGLGSRVAALLDGFSMAAGDGGDVKFDALPMFAAERVEVIKGAGSALYGSGALGGVVNVITKQPTEQAEILFRAYSGVHTLPTYDEWRWRETLPFIGGADLGFMQKMDKLSLLLTGGVKKTEGHQAYLAVENWNVLGKIGYEFSPQTTMNLVFQHAEETRDNWTFWQSLRSATQPPTGTNFNERLRSIKSMTAVDVRHTFSNDVFGVVRAGIYRTNFFTFNRGANAPLINDIASIAYSINAEAQITALLSDATVLTAGTTINHNFITRSPIVVQSSLNNTQTLGSLYAQVEHKPLAGLTLTAGSRFDVEQTTSLSQSGLIASPKLGASYVLTPATTLRASFGVGFRAPSLAERFAALRFGSFDIQPNPTLRNERSWSSEIGAQTKFSLFGEDWSLDASGFWNEFTDLIEPRFPTATNPQIQFQNITKARIQGIEVGLTGWLPNRVLGIEASATLMNPLDLNTNQTLKYRTRYLWFSRLIMPIGALQFQAEYRFQGRFDEIDNEIIQVIPNADARVNIHVVDVRMQANLLQIAGVPVLASVIGRNILNYNYVEIIGNLAPTRSIVLQVEMKL
jgi:outer membrane receptor for ferrienterochelin and colicins